MNSTAKPIVVAYVASPHAGYLKLFRAYEGTELYLLGETFISEHQPLVRNLPALNPHEACAMIEALGIFTHVYVLTPKMLPAIWGEAIVMPDEDVSHAFAAKHLPGERITFDGRWKLRWDSGAVANDHGGETASMNEDEAHHVLMKQAQNMGARSPDWWRQVGAVLTRDGKPIATAYNTHMPSDQSAYVMGDPRSNFGPGEHIDMSLSLHAEVAVLMDAARRGEKTEGCDLYATTFPCPPCARAIAASGVARLFYCYGYSLVGGKEALDSRGVEVIRIKK